MLMWSWMQLMKLRSFKMDKVYTLKFNTSGGIEYLDENETLEDIYGAIEALEDELLEILSLLKQQDKDDQFNILEDDISF